MKLARLALPLLAALAFALVGCSPQGEPDKTASTKPAQPYEAVAAQGKGFTVGAMMSTNTVYVMFDPQCPHCGHLWEAALPLQSKIKFVWVPVAFINAKSASQGAALLGAANPAELMATHEKSILAGSGGIAASASPPAELEQAIKKNTELFNSMGAESVPFVLARNLRSGQAVSHTGALSTGELANFLGVDQP